MNVTVSEPDTPDVDPRVIATFANAVLTAEGLEDDCSVTIDFVDDATIAALNAEHMGKAGPTDVLSFPIEDAEPGSPPLRVEGGPPVELGDIFICTNVVHQHAAEYEVTFSDELHLMVCHGLLHLLGWDHMTDADAQAMEARERELLATVGIERR
jgi:probable rRNA maturation factor